ARRRIQIPFAVVPTMSSSRPSSSRSPAVMLEAKPGGAGDGAVQHTVGRFLIQLKDLRMHTAGAPSIVVANAVSFRPAPSKSPSAKAVAPRFGGGPNFAFSKI